MKPCPHKHVEARIWSRHWKEWLRSDGTIFDALICRDCRAWLGVGESDEGPVAVEVRAAEIASSLEVAEVPRIPLCETHGWESHVNGDDPVLCSPYRFWAGWLAREIATHHDDPLAEAIEQAERAGV